MYMSLHAYTSVCVRVGVCTCVKEGVRKLTCHVITEISWTDSSADEWLRINRLLFSLNSCLSTSLIKTRRCGEKIKPANGNRFPLISFSLEDESAVETVTLPGQKRALFINTCEQRPLGYGSVVFVNLTLV